MKPSVLVVDDEQDVLVGYSTYLERRGYSVRGVSSLAEAREALRSQRWDAVLLDLRLPDGNGLDWLSDLRKACPGAGIMVITGIGDIPVAVEAMRRGADGFLTKPVNMAELDVFLRKSVELDVLRRGDLARRRLAEQQEPYFGESAAAKEILDLASVAAQNDSPVLLQGETGTGKGLLARWIHDHSSRRSQPYVEVNCSALKGDLLASELFGHVRGAFTSAVRDRQGLIEVADGGTLFLDEIADMEEEVQAQFLKVIEEKQYRRLGDVHLRKSEFRVICATNQDLATAVREGRFRQDLYFRINVFPITLVPLRERLEDLPGLVQHTLRTLHATQTELPQEVMDLLKAYSWPGNIRELRNVLERALLLAHGGPISVRHFPGLNSAHNMPNENEVEWNLDAHQRALCRRAVQHFGSVEKAAKALGVSKRTVYRKLQKL